jgi:GNAT superfamily N-acetyltransferase
MPDLDRVQIRPASQADADAVTALYVASWNAGFLGFLPEITASSARVERWRMDLAAPPPHRWWVAERDGILLGFAGIGPARDPPDTRLGELDTIAVHPDSWRRGLGRALMAQSITQLAQDGYRSAILWTLDGYDRARCFYRVTGWRPDGVTRASGTQMRWSHPLRPGRP